MPYYQLGNCLRGYSGGEFDTDEEAWDVLSKRFDNSYPSRCGREVELMKVIREGVTPGGNETKQQRELREKMEKMRNETQS